jgi:hypothetical protein
MNGPKYNAKNSLAHSSASTSGLGRNKGQARLDGELLRLSEGMYLNQLHKPFIFLSLFLGLFILEGHAHFPFLFVYPPRAVRCAVKLMYAFVSSIRCFSTGWVGFETHLTAVIETQAR